VKTVFVQINKQSQELKYLVVRSVDKWISEGKLY